MTTLYGIPNCDTIRSARRWLTDHDIEYTFHDFRKNGLDEALLRQWVSELGWEALLNKRGLTWRKLDQDTKDAIDETSAIRLMLEHVAMIKRPVLDMGDRRVLGFKLENYAELFQQ